MNFLRWIFGRTKPLDVSGIAILDHARKYLEQYGRGRNFEYDRARQILALARERVINELLTKR